MRGPRQYDRCGRDADDHHCQSEGTGPLPESLRDRYGFPPGTKVVWLERDGDLIPKPLLSVEQLHGRFEGGELAAMLLEERGRDRTHQDG